MDEVSKNKILTFKELKEKVQALQKSGKKVVQSHGIFDLIHPGIINHLNSARAEGDILIVTVIKDEDVRKMPGRPVFPGKMRLENVASLIPVDYVALVDDTPPFECIRQLKPDVFAKGRAYLERDEKIHGNAIGEEVTQLPPETRVFETIGFSFSSSQIINSLLDMYPDDTKAYLKDFSSRYSFSEIVKYIDDLRKMKVLIIGDGIIDEYHYCQTMGKSAKAHLVVNQYLFHEVFAGGAFAIANHTAGICEQVELVTLLGRNDSRESFVRDNLKKNVKAKFYFREDGPTIVKKRYINHYLNNKLFEINYLDDTFIDSELEEQIIEDLITILPDFDLVLVSDFGHGLITKKMMEIIEKHSTNMAVNTQTNGANTGYNLITKYGQPHFICLDEPEARLATQIRFGHIEEVLQRLSERLNTDSLIVTQGKHGSIAINKSGEIVKTPVFSSKVVDTIGAGDAFFAFTAPCYANKLPLDFTTFVGNAAASIAIQIMGNKRPVEKSELLEFMHTILK